MELSAPFWQIAKSACKFYLSQWFVKKWRRDAIPLPSSGARMFVDVRENRGRALFILEGQTQPRLHRFWQQAVHQWQPDYVLDVGVNYGECLFSVRYPEHCQIVGIEANLALKPYIERSKSTHPNHPQMRLHYAIASDQAMQQQTFYVNKYWSGISSAVSGRRFFKKMYQSHVVDQITVDSIWSTQPLENSKLLFKIDVEGYEPKVLAGMKTLIRRCPHMLGFIEFDSDYIERAGYEANQFLQTLSADFEVYAYLANERLVRITGFKMAELQRIFEANSIHTDFVIVSPNMQWPIMNEWIETEHTIKQATQ